MVLKCKKERYKCFKIIEDGKMINCSLIIRTKNEEENLGHCIKAIKSQSIKNVEIIIVDNLSSDNTLKIVSL